jgi:hypothetical protein
VVCACAVDAASASNRAETASLIVFIGFPLSGVRPALRPA